MEFNPFEFLIYFLVFTLGLRAVYPFCSLMHEFGHAIPALLLTKGDVRIQSGIGDTSIAFKIGRLKIVPIFSAAYNGFCEFAQQGVSSRQLALITLGGPILSGVLTGISISCLINPWLLPLLRGICAIFFYANLRIFITSVIPAYHTIPRDAPVGASDGLRFLEFWKGKSG
jgi:hypothetical protein